jgi:glycogen debranching enzyme
MGSWKSSEKGYLMVEPQLSIRGEPLMSLDEIMLQTMVPKWMGPMKEWDAYFELAQSTGYNMIHFIPVQKRGISNSPYSIVDYVPKTKSISS